MRFKGIVINISIKYNLKQVRFTIFWIRHMYILIAKNVSSDKKCETYIHLYSNKNNIVL